MLDSVCLHGEHIMTSASESGKDTEFEQAMISNVPVDRFFDYLPDVRNI
jgi:hypothetical protein